MSSLGHTLVFDFSHWKIILAVALIVFGALLYRRTIPSLPRRRRFALAALRVLGFCLLVLFVVDPVAVSVRTEEHRPLVLVLFDVSRSMALPDEGGTSRRDRAEEGLRILSATLREHTDATIDVVPFSSALFPGPVDEDSLPPAEGDGTDIEGALSASRARYRSRNLAAVVLLSDGRITRPAADIPEPFSVPLYAVGFGDTIEGADIAVERVLYERIVYAGTAARIQAIVGASGFPGERVEIRLEEGDAALDATEIRIEPGTAEYSVRFDFAPRTAGERLLSVRALAPPKDRRPENDVESIRVRVLKERVRIALIDQHADWNATFLLDLARRSPRLDLEAAVWMPGSGFRTLPDGGAWRAPELASDFERYDLVIVADDAGIFATERRVDALERFVEAGGAVLLLADEHSPLRLSAAAGLARLLPILVSGPVIVETGEYETAVSRDGEMHPLAAAFLEAAAVEGPPPLTGRLANIDAAAGAEVPLVMREGAREFPFCAVQRRGEGVTAIVFGFPLWRWRLADEEGAGLYDDFFGGLIQYLADGFDAPALDIMTDRTVYRSGDMIGLTAYVRDDRGVDGVRGEVLRIGAGAGTVERTFLFEPERGRRGYYRTELEPLAPGEYRITASEIRSGGTGSSGEAICSVQPVSVELIAPSRDNVFLRRLARSTGGTVVEADAIGTLPSRLDLSVESRRSLERQPLRGRPWFFAAIVIVFAAEWVLRKAWGLV